MNAKLMIMSLGGSPEPLKKSIAEHRPERIVFFASHDSILKAGDVLPQPGARLKVESEITEDPSSLFECYKAARRCVDRAAKSGISDAETMVDYTGGTKVMTAALILATVGRSYRFNYVGGDSRTKNGLGIVENGHEVMYSDMNPWSAFAEEERRQVVLLFNRHRYSAVVEIIRIATDRDLPREITEYFRFVQPLATGLSLWDQFNHKEAASSLAEGIKRLRDYAGNYADPKWEEMLAGMECCKKMLDGILRDTHGLSRFHYVLIDDLLNNARRRMTDSRYDDAAARIYRALELYGQIVFMKVAGCSNSNVPLEKIPEPIRNEFIRKYADPQTGTIRLPLQATFRFLQAARHEAGIRFFQKIAEIKKIQNNRNESILAHGINPVGVNAAESIFRIVSEFVGFRNIMDFPRLP